MMRRSLMRLLPFRGLLVLPLLAGCGSRQPESETDKPIAKLQNERIIRITNQIVEHGGVDTLRFGHMHSGEILLMQVWVANESQHPVVMTDYVRSCGCTTLEFDSQPILSGRARRMNVLFDARGEWGWQFKQVEVQLAGAQRPLRIYVEADVE